MRKIVNYNISGSFDSWIVDAECTYNNKYIVHPSQKIPDRMYQEFLDSVNSLSVYEIKRVLRVLMRGGTTDNDWYHFDTAIDRHKRFSREEGFYKYNINNDEKFNRLLFGFPGSEGITWCLRLLPTAPLRVINIINEYIHICCQELSDDMFIGLKEAKEIIQKRFIDVTHPQEILHEIAPNDFEIMIKILFEKMGYQAELTPRTHDGGKDVIVIKENVYLKEKIYIECKRYDKMDLNIETVRAFAYSVIKDEINKGIIICTGHVPKFIEATDQRIEIVNYDTLVRILNSYWGDWITELQDTLDKGKIEARKKLKNI